ncbi:MAG: acyl carrier protein [Rhodospirillales bacterium]
MSQTPLIEPHALVAEALECSIDDLVEGTGLGAHPKWDSLAHVRVMLALERHYDVTLNDDSILKYTTLDAVSARHQALVDA